MKHNCIEAGEKLPMDEGDRRTQREIKESVRKWRRATCYLGSALIVSAGAWFSLFFPGRALYPLWETWGRVFAVTSLCIFIPCLYAAATTVNLWLYGASLRKIDRDFADGKTDKY